MPSHIMRAASFGHNERHLLQMWQLPVIAATNMHTHLWRVRDVYVTVLFLWGLDMLRGAIMRPKALLPWRLETFIYLYTNGCHVYLLFIYLFITDNLSLCELEQQYIQFLYL